MFRLALIFFIVSSLAATIVANMFPVSDPAVQIFPTYSSVVLLERACSPNEVRGDCLVTNDLSRISFMGWR